MRAAAGLRNRAADLSLAGPGPARHPTHLAGTDEDPKSDVGSAGSHDRINPGRSTWRVIATIGSQAVMIVCANFVCGINRANRIMPLRRCNRITGSALPTAAASEPSQNDVSRLSLDQAHSIVMSRLSKGCHSAGVNRTQIKGIWFRSALATAPGCKRSTSRANTGACKVTAQTRTGIIVSQYAASSRLL